MTLRCDPIDFLVFLGREDHIPLQKKESRIAKFPMSANCFKSLLLIPLVALVACRNREIDSFSNEASTLLARGGWVEEAFQIDLRGHTGAPAENPLLWRPLPLIGVEGWDPAARGWRPIGSRSLLSVWYRGPQASHLVLELRNRTGEGRRRTFELEVELNGRLLGTRTVESGRFRDELTIPAGLLRTENQIALGFSPPLEPDLELGHPVALLGIGFSTAFLDQRSGSGESAAAMPDSRSIRLAGSGTYVLPLTGLQPLASVDLELEQGDSELGVVSIERLEADGARRLIESFRLGPSSTRTIHVPIEKPRVAGTALLIHSEVSRQDSWLGLRNQSSSPVALDESRKAPSAQAGSAIEGSLPDVILIILDAARGDRFPGWQYPRRIMPNIDRFASSAMVFRRAYTECPTTSCSIPALLTGVSLLGGGEVGGGREMSEDLTTLAEYLRASGYRTVGFSATPNDSASRNMDQGFDEFHELWGRDNPDHGPFNLSRLAGDILEAQPDGEPLYLQLHYLPPHQPYAPGTEFDRFTDESYSGPIEPKMSLKPFNLGRERLSPADLRELIGLYDGNLLRADAAVGQLLRSLRETGRLENSIIILTSDHGEAFMEHGYQGHNTTLFDEMLHVPLVIRLPFGSRRPSPWLDRPSSLLDVVPTVLGALDLEPVKAVDGWNLFEPESTDQTGRILLARTSHAEQPMISVRSELWKSIVWPKHQVQMLFDIVNDPGERENRIGEAPWMFANLGLIARDRLLRARARGYRQGEEVTLDRETEEALRALGYLD